MKQPKQPSWLTENTIVDWLPTRFAGINGVAEIGCTFDFDEFQVSKRGFANARIHENGVPAFNPYFGSSGIEIGIGITTNRQGEYILKE